MDASRPPPLALLAYAELSEFASRQDKQALVQPYKADFESRTGAFATLDPWHDARMRAFHDELATLAAFQAQAPLRDASLAQGRIALERAFRGLFQLGSSLREDEVKVVNMVDRAEYYVTVSDLFLRKALLAVEEALFDGRVVVTECRLMLLPGAFLHPEEATKSIEALVASPKCRDLPPSVLLDRLMKMEHQLRVRSRVRPNQVYRADAL